MIPVLPFLIVVAESTHFSILSTQNNDTRSDNDSDHHKPNALTCGVNPDTPVSTHGGMTPG